jgi:hypothetical protein
MLNAASEACSLSRELRSLPRSCRVRAHYAIDWHIQPTYQPAHQSGVFFTSFNERAGLVPVWSAFLSFTVSQNEQRFHDYCLDKRELWGQGARL